MSQELIENFLIKTIVFFNKLTFIERKLTLGSCTNKNTMTLHLWKKEFSSQIQINQKKLSKNNWILKNNSRSNFRVLKMFLFRINKLNSTNNLVIQKKMKSLRKLIWSKMNRFFFESFRKQILISGQKVILRRRHKMYRVPQKILL